MTWVAWRLQRTETLIAAGILALIACLLVPTGIQMANAYHHDGLASCVMVNVSPSCAQAVGDFTSHYGYLANLVTLFTLVPGIFGVLLAAPFVLDLENGTYRLAWTQSITRRRWLTGKLGIAIPGALAAALVLTLLVTWWRTPFTSLNGRLQNQSFDFDGTVVLGYTLFALGLAAAVGAVWRKAVPALIVAFGGYFAARILVDAWLRQHLITPNAITWAANKLGPNLSHAWVLSEGPSTKAGAWIGPHTGGGVGGTIHIAVPRCISVGPQITRCHNPGGSYIHAVYFAASRFWELQAIETALFGGVALVLLAFAAWWTHERLA